MTDAIFPSGYATSTSSAKWSPAGDGIAFLNIDGLSTDLRLAKLGGTPGAWTVDEIVPLTDVSGLDAASKPDWYIPADQLPAASSSPAP